jgi:toxin CcdB
VAQFDIHTNPINAARRAYPWVIRLQSDLLDESQDAVVAPLVPRRALGVVAGRLTPIVSIDGDEYVVLVNGLTTLSARDLTKRSGNLRAHRDAMLAAIDLLFFGI